MGLLTSSMPYIAWTTASTRLAQQRWSGATTPVCWNCDRPRVQIRRNASRLPGLIQRATARGRCTYSQQVSPTLLFIKSASDDPWPGLLFCICCRQATKTVFRFRTCLCSTWILCHTVKENKMKRRKTEEDKRTCWDVYAPLKILAAELDCHDRTKPSNAPALQTYLLVTNKKRGMFKAWRPPDLNIAQSDRHTGMGHSSNIGWCRNSFMLNSG